MAIYNYGIGGNEVKVDANESIAEIGLMGKNFKQQIYHGVHIAYIGYTPKLHSLL